MNEPDGGPRRINGLLWAHPCTKPRFAAEAPPSPAKRLGLRFEQRVKGALTAGTFGAWYEFQDSRGLGYCQPDIWLRASGPAFPQPFIMVLEVKLTWNIEAKGQIQRLYKPILEEVEGLPVRGVIVCKSVTPWTPRPRIFGTLHEAIDASRPDDPAILHWPGRNPTALAVPLGFH